MKPRTLKPVSYAPHNPLRATTDGSFDLTTQINLRPEALNKKEGKKELKRITSEIDELQQKLYAQDKYSVLCVFQAIDAAGKDSTIRNVFGRLNPAGCQVHSFKAPSKEELDHDFLWRTSCRLPERGRIGVFNRSYYEEALVVRVHPEFLQSQRLDVEVDDAFWQQRYESINEHEKHLSRNGTVVLKFWLNVSKQEQKRRFLSRLEESEKHWKFTANDLSERGHWDEYMDAYADCIRATSTGYAPWYVIPADNKLDMRVQVADIVRQTLQAIDPQFPEIDPSERARFADYIQQLENEA